MRNTIFQQQIKRQLIFRWHDMAKYIHYPIASVSEFK